MASDLTPQPVAVHLRPDDPDVVAAIDAAEQLVRARAGCWPPDGDPLDREWASQQVGAIAGGYVRQWVNDHAGHVDPDAAVALVRMVTSHALALAGIAHTALVTAFHYRHPDGDLTAAEVDPLVERVVASYRQVYGL